MDSIPTGLQHIAPLITIVRSFLYVPTLVVNPQDRLLINAIEHAFRCRLTSRDRVCIFVDDDVEFTTRSNALRAEDGVIALHCSGGKDADCTLAYESVQFDAVDEELMRRYIPSHPYVPSPNVCFVRQSSERYYPARRESRCRGHWLVFRQSSWVGATSARRFTYYLIDEQRFRFT